jgi:hypothetical protein
MITHLLYLQTTFASKNINKCFEQSTEFKRGVGDILDLTKHYINCDGYVLNSLSLLTSAEENDKFRYSYKCCPFNFKNSYPDATDLYPVGYVGDIKTVENFNITCGENNSLISNLKLRQIDDGIRYEFLCLQSPSKLKCSNIFFTAEKPLQTGVNGLLQFDDLVCPDNYGFNWLQLVKGVYGFHYEYECCIQLDFQENFINQDISYYFEPENVGPNFYDLKEDSDCDCEGDCDFDDDSQDDFDCGCEDDCDCDEDDYDERDYDDDCDCQDDCYCDQVDNESGDLDKLLENKNKSDNFEDNYDFDLDEVDNGYLEKSVDSAIENVSLEQPVDSKMEQSVNSNSETGQYRVSEGVQNGKFETGQTDEQYNNSEADQYNNYD